MTAAGRMAGIEFAFPVDFAGVEIDGIEEIMEGDFVGELEVARVQAIQKLLAFEALLREFGDVVVGIGRAGLRLFGLAVGGDGGEEDALAGDDRRRPAEAGEGRGPFDV